MEINSILIVMPLAAYLSIFLSSKFTYIWEIEIIHDENEGGNE